MLSDPEVERERPPRHVVCYLNSFRMKEEILRKAQNQIQITFNSADINIYQDLSNITLQHLETPAGCIMGL